MGMVPHAVWLTFAVHICGTTGAPAATGAAIEVESIEETASMFG